MPGNHDRRRAGIIGPHREELFLALREALGDDAWVHGCWTPFLAELMPEGLFPIPLWIIAYDTTYLPHGLLSAGGAFRQEDLLHAAAGIGDSHPDWPILVLLHHHLVPTPLTDLGPIELGERTNPVVRWGVERVLPGIIAHADREELTMTALGAGTALSTLHSMGRAVLVLHGHKHYATARMLNGTIAGQGDVIVVSAGSAGVAQTWHQTTEEDAARLWPSFNVIDLTDNLLRVDTWAFAWKTAATQSRRPLVRARREGSQWLVEPVPLDYADPGPRLVHNRSHIRLETGAAAGYWDYTCEREVLASDDSPLIRCVETVTALAGARCIMNDKGAEVPLPTHVHLDVGGKVHFRVVGGLCCTLPPSAEDFR